MAAASSSNTSIEENPGDDWFGSITHAGTSSHGKDILKAKRASLADETFEMLMLMRGNKHHVTIS